MSEDRAEEFNKAALAVMKKHKVGNLYDLILTRRSELQLAGNDVHYNQKGREILAKQVAFQTGTSLDMHEPNVHASKLALNRT